MYEIEYWDGKGIDETKSTVRTCSIRTVVTYRFITLTEDSNAPHGYKVVDNVCGGGSCCGEYGEWTEYAQPNGEVYYHPKLIDNFNVWLQPDTGDNYLALGGGYHDIIRERVTRYRVTI